MPSSVSNQSKENALVFAPPLLMSKTEEISLGYQVLYATGITLMNAAEGKFGMFLNLLEHPTEIRLDRVQKSQSDIWKS